MSHVSCTKGDMRLLILQPDEEKLLILKPKEHNISNRT